MNEITPETMGHIRKLKITYNPGAIDKNPCAESKQSELDKDNARIAQLEEFILSITKCSGGMINGNRASMAAENVLALSSSTWLSEHDKATEVRILKEVREKTKDIFGFKV